MKNQVRVMLPQMAAKLREQRQPPSLIPALSYPNPFRLMAGIRAKSQPIMPGARACRETWQNFINLA